MFRMYGHQIQINRYSVTTTNDDSEIEVSFFPTLEEASHYGQAVAVDTTAIEWLDGIEVEPDGDTYSKAMSIYNMGEAAYLEMINKPTPEQLIIYQQEQISQLQLLVAMQGGAIIG